MADLQQIGKYKILGKIGQGAMGEVFKAHDPILNRYVAIKTMSAAIGSDDELRKRFLREAQSAARLNHPNIITLYDFGEDQGKIYMAMELLQGADLKDLLGSHSLNSIEDKVGLMEQTCDGLAFAHANQVVHRDLKPANIHIQPNGQVKIMDFGLARLGASEMTRTGMVMGTPNYMSPEQVRGQRADARSDIFALGAVFYELLTNHKAFDAESLHAVLFQVLEHEPEPVRNWVPDVPEVLVHLVERALRKEPAARFQNAGELREALRLVRQVFEGTLDEESAIHSILTPSPETSEATILSEQPAADAEATRIEPTPGTPGSSPDMKRSGIGKRPGSGSRPPAMVAGAPTRVNPGSGATVVSPRSGSRGPGLGAGRSMQRSGGSVSRSGAARMAPQPAARSNMPLILGGIAVFVLAAALGVFFALRPSKPATPADDPLKDAMVTSSLQSARQSLEYKNFAAAITSAQQVLKLDQGNAEAKQILDKAETTLKQLDAAAEEAKLAVQAGNFDKASEALQRAMEINPTHPVVAELSRQLDSTFKGKAEDARQSMRSARTGAERARATNLQSFTEATQAAGEAEGLFKSEKFTAATQKFLEAQNQYDRARRAAEDRAATPPPTTMAQFAPPPQTQPPVTLPPTTLPPVTAPPVTTPPHTPPPTPPPPVNEEPAVRRVITDYKRALESKDLGLFKAIKPNLSADDEKKLRDSFGNIRTWEVAIDIESVHMDGDRAVVRISRRDTVNGQRTQPQSQTFTLVKGGGSWTIRDIGRD